MQRAEPTSPVTSNITTPNDDTTIGIAARAPPENAQLGNNHFIVMHGQGSLSCSKDAAKLQYLKDSMVSMKDQLRLAVEVLGVEGVEQTLGAEVFFGPGTLLTCLHGLNAEFGAALSSDADIESIRATNYAWPLQFISSADQKPVERYSDINSYPHPGRAILFGCPTTPEAEWRATSPKRCVDNEKRLAYTLMQPVSTESNTTTFTEIMLCPSFFRTYFLNRENSGRLATSFNQALDSILRPQNPPLDFSSHEAGA